jgi:citrate synthase
VPVIITVLAANDPLRFHLDPPAVVAAGQGIVAGLVDCLPAPAPEEPEPDGSISRRLWAG